MKHEFKCHNCKSEIVHISDTTTGYATDKEGNKICFHCCGELDKKELASLPIGGKTIMYLDTQHNELTNWPGTLKIPLSFIRKGRHNMAGNRYDTWFRYSGNYFHAVQYGDNTQIAHIKRVKPF